MHTMKYSNIEFEVNIPETQIACELESNVVDLPQRSVKEHIEYALDNPIGAGDISTVVKKGDKVAIIISDITRKWQAIPTYLPILVDRLNKCGIADEDIIIVSACGTHRRQTDAEHKELLGEDLFKRLKIVDHQCDDKEHLVYMGETSRKTPVWLNKYAIDADKIILTGGVVYHFLAGYGGGRKSLVPGIAGKETINTNHCNALNPGFGQGINENVYSGNLSKENPFHDDLEEAAAMAKPAYLLNVVANSDQQIIAAFAGDWIKAHKAATELVDSIDGIYVDERADLVIASAGGFPKDINLYQTSKTLSNSKSMIDDVGTMIILSECSEGFGNQDCEDQIVKFTNMEDRERALRADFSIGGFVGFDFSDTAERYNMILVTEIPADKFKNTKIHVVKTLDEALRVAKELNNGSIDNMKVALLPHGANTLPKYR